MSWRLFSRDKAQKSHSEDLSSLFYRSLRPNIAVGLSITPTIATAIDHGIPDSIITQPTDPIYTEVDDLPSNVDVPLLQLKQERLKFRGEDVYVPPRAKASLRARENFDLATKVQEFLVSDGKVFLILGDSGAGKSTFSRTLEINLWVNYSKFDGRIPLFIDLPGIDGPEQDLIAKSLRKAGFTENQILELKIHREFILICDGYDEALLTRNLYMSNQVNKPGEWRAQMVISCQTGYCGVDYKDLFRPINWNTGDMGEFQEAIISPFDKDQIQDYIEQYVSLKELSWRSEDYWQALKQVPNLQDLVKNPCLLVFTLEMLPRLLSANDKFSVARITRVGLYDDLVVQWIERSKNRLRDMELNSHDGRTFKQIMDSGFRRQGIAFLKELAVAIYDHQDGKPVVDYSEHDDLRTWKEVFFGNRGGSRLLLEVIPIIRNGDHYQFIHKSLLEYGLSLAVFDPNEHVENTELVPVISRCDSTNSAIGYEAPELVETTDTAIEQSLLESPFGRRSFVYESSVLQFLVERVRQQPKFREQLLAAIERSKTVKTARTAAANAITILVRAGVQFNGTDLRGIQIPRADLSNGVFDSANLERADLRQTNLRNIWLRGANLRGSRMNGVRFGELKFQEEDSEVRCSAYSPNGRRYAVGLANGDISLYDTSIWNRVLSMKGHSKGVSYLAYSSTGLQIASGGADETVRLWDITTGDCVNTLIGHRGPIRGVAYSPKGHQLASGSWDKTVRLWDIETGDCVHTLQGHTFYVTSIAYSPNGDRIVSGSWDNTVRLWNAETGECIYILQGHSSYVWSVVYSPKGNQIASGSEDKAARLWDTETGDCLHVLNDHTGEVTNVVYSPSGSHIASGNGGGTVLLWDVNTGRRTCTLHGHSGPVVSIVYSPNGEQIASGSWDKTVRLWDVGTGDCIQTLDGHSRAITSVTYSPYGHLIVSGGDDKTVRLWYADHISDHTDTSHGHSEPVTSVACSPKGDQVASGSQDRTVRLWSVDTSECIKSLHGHTDFISKVVYSPTRSQVASGSRDMTVRLWDLDTGNCTLVLQGHIDSVTCVVYSPEGDQVASGSRDKTVRLWDVDTGECTCTLQGHTSYVTGVVYSPEGDHIASGGWDKTLRLWDVKTGSCFHILQGHSDPISCVAYSLKGDQIASGSSDMTVRLWNVNSGKCIHVLKGHSGPVTSVAHSPKGDRVASGSADKAVRLWNTDTGECIHTLQGHSESVTSVMFLNGIDGILSGSLDKTGRLWDFESGECLITVPDFNGGADCIAYGNSLDGQYIVAASADKSIHHWRVLRDISGYKLFLSWSTSREEFTVYDSDFSDVQGLSPLDQELLSQRGALMSASR